ncbi:cyclic nucleotide-binding domain-containing protein [Anianabacter salinae]|uniref:cyclic nucleotide-binding domain-containing protein n=1 Tax=Anianabacter salinae TaxID=2851023 RepID=UPI00225E3699|nr:cyclic nucleotide-binding domain-containing protein [Anianabacter salinae]MBV0911773.1 cyclic nucleotide-binding domain-containing protein [Anianabacter salinae]
MTNAAALAANPKGSAHPARSAAVGMIVGFDLVGRAVAMATVIFAGTLAAGAAAGTMLMVMASLLATVSMVATGRSNWPVIGAVQQAPFAVLLPFFFALSALPATPEATFTANATAFALLGLTSVLTGVAMLALAYLRLDRMIRLMPYPVSAGFLAATGALLMLAAIIGALPAADRNLAALVSVSPSTHSPLFLTLGFGLVLGLAYRLLRERGLVFAIIGGIALFYTVLSAKGIDLPEARALGLLPYSPQGISAVAPSPAMLAAIDWDFVRAALPNILAAAMISVLGLALNLTGIELALRRDLDTARTLKVSGVTNIALGAVGGTIGYPSSTTTITAQDMGANHKALAFGVIGMLTVGFFLVGDIIAFVPGFLSSGLLLYIGAGILARWFVWQRPRQTLPDWLLAGAIVLISVLFGVLEAIAVGVLAASMIFAFSYGRLPVVTQISDLSARRSAVDRGPAETRRLDRQAGQVVTLRLDGFLFFGSTEQLVAEIRTLLATRHDVRIVILDFQRVRGVDSAALAALGKVEHLAEARGAQVVIAAARPEVAEALDRQGLALPGTPALVRAGTADEALASAEERILATPPQADEETAQSALTAILGDAAITDALMALMTRRSIRAGDRIITHGQTTGEIYLIDEGRLGIYAPLADGKMLRVRSLRAGALVGEIASYTGLARTADVVAEVDSTVYVVDPAELESAMAGTPELAAWHKLIAITLAEKLSRTTLMLRDLA